MQDEYRKPIPIHLRDRLTPEARVKYDALAPNIQEMYRTEKCAMCGVKIPDRQISKVIIDGVPSLCSKDHLNYKAAAEKLAPLFGQLSL
jgi:hypothetical protein